MERIYSDGISPEELRNKLRDITRDTKSTHQVHDMRYPAWGLGLVEISPNAESGNVLMDAIMTVPPGAEAPRNGDVMIIPLKGQEKPAVGMIIDPEPMPGDWIGDAYQVSLVQHNPQQAIGHEFIAQGRGSARGGRG